MKTTDRLNVAEYFYSLQGEGHTMGVPAIFLRLAGCNLLCGRGNATWECDSIQVWRNGTNRYHKDLIESMDSHHDLLKRLENKIHLVITGGEPLLQQERLANFIHMLLEKYDIANPVIEMETNGTIMPNLDMKQHIRYWNVSPKLSNSGEPLEKRMIWDPLTYFALHPKAMFKFVVKDEKDVTEIYATFIDKLKGIINIDELKRKIWLMPACENIEDLMSINQVVAELAISNNFNFTSRLQIEIWNQTTGV